MSDNKSHSRSGRPLSRTLVKTLALMALSAMPALCYAEVRQDACIFGSHLVETARFKDFTASPETVLRISQGISDAWANKVRQAFGRDAAEPLADIAGSQGEFWARSLVYQPSQTEYVLILSDPGDNVYGGILDGEQLVASIGDGHIADCQVAFAAAANNQFFKKLPQQQNTSRNCYFGSTLVELERLRDFTVKKRPPLSHGCYNTGHCAAVTAEYEISDTHGPGGRAYYLDVHERNGQTDGHIVSKAPPHFVLATVTDGRIEQCAGEFFDYDSLPWFYTN